MGSPKLAGMRLQLATVCKVCVVPQPYRETLFYVLDVNAGRGRRHYRGSLKYQRRPSGASTV